MGIPIPRPQPRHVARVERLLADLRIEGLRSTIERPIPRGVITLASAAIPGAAPALSPAYAPKGVSMGAGGPPRGYSASATIPHRARAMGAEVPRAREIHEGPQYMGMEEITAKGLDEIKVEKSKEEEESLDFFLGGDAEGTWGSAEEVDLLEEEEETPRKNRLRELMEKISRVRGRERREILVGGAGEDMIYRGAGAEIGKAPARRSLGPKAVYAPAVAAGAAGMRRESVPIPAGVARVARVIPHQDDINTLEKILSEVYTSDVTITSIQDLPVTRKQVKRVFFDVKGYLCQVFVLKADPLKTNRELCTYQIAYNHSVPTGMPIGFLPEDASGKYPYETALLGGEIINDAGEPYKELLGKLDLTPHLMMDTANTIAKIIADYQMNLSYAYSEFKDRKLNIPVASPKKEIRDRILARLALEDYKAQDLLNAVEELASKQSGWKVINHGDIHLRNITSVFDIYNQGSAQTQKGWNLSRFGVIDWESLCMDNPYADLMDFFVHFERTASTISRRPHSFSFDEISLSYSNQLKNRMFERKIKFNPNDLSRDAKIQNALWHAYEILDPTRKGSPDEESIAEHHIAYMKVGLQNLYSDPECRSSAKAIEDAVDRILS